MGKFRLTTLIAPCVVASLLPGSIGYAAMPFQLSGLSPKSQSEPPSWQFMTDITSEIASPEAVSLARQLDLVPRFKRLQQLRSDMNALGESKPSSESRLELSEVKEEIIETIEQTRLEADYVQAELSVEIAAQNELLRELTSYRDHIVNRANQWSFRTNGALWAIGEALDIPTYSHPRYSISSGTIGILAGLVPSVFSIFAIHASAGPHIDRAPRPNLLAPLFQFPTTIRRLEYPKSVWDFLHSPPSSNPSGKSRLDMLVGHWVEDSNIHLFSDKCSNRQIEEITGVTAQSTTINLVSDRLNMLDQLHALINHMNRPLLELMMVVRGTKHLDVNAL
jgi:hypothetical protein